MVAPRILAFNLLNSLLPAQFDAVIFSYGVDESQLPTNVAQVQKATEVIKYARQKEGDSLSGLLDAIYRVAPHLNPDLSQENVQPIPTQPALVQTFTFKATVDHEESRDIEQRFALPPNYRIVRFSQPQEKSKVGHTYLLKIEVDPNAQNALIVAYHVEGQGVDRVVGQVVNRRGRGWIEADIEVEAVKIRPY